MIVEKTIFRPNEIWIADIIFIDMKDKQIYLLPERVYKTGCNRLRKWASDAMLWTKDGLSKKVKRVEIHGIGILDDTAFIEPNKG